MPIRSSVCLISSRVFSVCICGAFRFVLTFPLQPQASGLTSDSGHLSIRCHLAGSGAKGRWKIRGISSSIFFMAP